MSCSLDKKPIDPTDIARRLKASSSAEDFFAMLGVPYDEAVLRVARLHILKRMGEYLAGDDLEGLPDAVAAARAAAVLQRAYSDFEFLVAAGAAGLQGAQGARPGPSCSAEDRVRRARRDRPSSSALKFAASLVVGFEGGRCGLRRPLSFRTRPFETCDHGVSRSRQRRVRRSDRQSWHSRKSEEMQATPSVGAIGTPYA